MAIYEYSCSKCGTVFEQLVFTADERPVCPSCGSDTLRYRIVDRGKANVLQARRSLTRYVTSISRTSPR